MTEPQLDSDARQLIKDMLAAFLRENELSRMGGPKGSGYFRCVLCEMVILPQGADAATIPAVHHHACPVPTFVRPPLDRPLGQPEYWKP